LEEGAEAAALDFIDELGRAFLHIGPGTGSGRYAHELSLPGLRFWPLARYFEQWDRVDVWRILHGKRDIPEWMHASEFDA
jgi:toxin ParE1/3/4